MEITIDSTSTTIIVHKEKALLHLHKKLGKWLPVGGHIEPGELPDMAALREVKEEAGLEVALYDPDKEIKMPDAKQLIRPIHILLVDINESHKHIDYLYYAVANTFEIKLQNGEATDFKWFTADELRELANVPENVRSCALEAIGLLG
jgi:8-oxo-dGTP pyrophosphatase MutT (NUDIX family)